MFRHLQHPKAGQNTQHLLFKLNHFASNLNTAGFSMFVNIISNALKGHTVLDITQSRIAQLVAHRSAEPDI